MRAYHSCLGLVLFFTLSLTPNAWGQLPEHLNDSNALAEAKKLLVPLVHSKQSTPRKSCAKELLRAKEEKRDYWQLINDALFARVAERDTAATTDEVELGLHAINDRLAQ